MAQDCLRELRTFYLTMREGDPANGTVFILDGVGGTLFAPICARRGLRAAGVPWAIHIHDWHTGPRGELLGDLVMYRRNQVRAAVFAEMIAERRRAYPHAPLHLAAFSGGTGIAAFALEKLPDDVQLDTVFLGCSALSPHYRLTPMLRRVKRCTAFVSRLDRLLLGVGTTVFGTIDRRYVRAAGLRGFRRPEPFDEEDRREYGKLRQLLWEPAMRAVGHYGHHVGCATTAFATQYIAPILTDTCRASTHDGPFDSELPVTADS